MSARRWVAGAVAAALVLAGAACTGVRDERAWSKAVRRGYPCTELVDIARKLPSSVDRDVVEADLRDAGCDPRDAGIGTG